MSFRTVRARYLSPSIGIVYLILFAGTTMAATESTAPPPTSEAPSASEAPASTAEGMANPVANTPPPAVVPLQSADGLPQLPPRDTFDPMLQRPLFSSSRRPDVIDNSSPSSETDLRNKWKLTGVVRVDQELRALFSEINGDKQLRLSVGMPLDNSWSVAEIHQHSVVLSDGEQQVAMELFVPRQIPATPAAPSQDQSQTNNPNDKVPASIEERTRAAVQQLRERVNAAKGGTQ